MINFQTKNIRRRCKISTRRGAKATTTSNWSFSRISVKNLSSSQMTWVKNWRIEYLNTKKELCKSPSCRSNLWNLCPNPSSRISLHSDKAATRPRLPYTRRQIQSTRSNLPAHSATISTVPPLTGVTSALSILIQDFSALIRNQPWKADFRPTNLTTTSNKLLTIKCLIRALLSSIM